MNFKKYFLYSAAAGIGLIGLGYTISPSFMFGNYDIQLVNVSELSMVRSAYGGMFLGFAVLFFLGGLKQQFSNAALLALFALMTGFAFGRGVSLVVDGIPHPIIVGVLGLELACSVGSAYFIFVAKETTATREITIDLRG